MPSYIYVKNKSKNQVSSDLVSQDGGDYTRGSNANSETITVYD
jgi:hypothetical protein